MKTKLLICSLLVAAIACGGASKDVLRIYLPREKVVDSDLLSLGAIAIMQGDGILIERAKEVALGRFSVAGQKMLIDRRTILSRLSASGIPVVQVQLSGAERMEVRRKEKVIGVDRFTELAESFLRSSLEADSISSINLIKKPQQWVCPPDSGEVKLTARAGRYSKSGKPRIHIGIVQDGVEVDGRDVVFEIKYKRQKAIASVDIPAGMTITPENVKVVKFESSAPASSDFSIPYGQVVRVGIRKGHQVTSALVGSANFPGQLESVVVIKRRQIVMAEIRNAGMFISMQGEALSDGRVGEYIKVKMGPERDARVIYAKVKPNGTVEPNF